MATSTRRERRQAMGAAGMTLRAPAALVCALAAGLPGWAQAQAWRIEPAVKSTAVLTDNVGFAATNPRSDTVLVLTPSLRLLGRGPRYEVTGSLAADGLVYLGRSLADRVFPQASIGLRTQVVDRLLFLDGDVSAQSTASDAFGPVGDGPTILNRSTVARARVSPRLERELTPFSRVSLRSDHAWSRGLGSDQTETKNDAYVQSQAGLYELRPLPAGMRLSFDREATTYRQQPGSELEFRTARATALYTFDQEAIWGLTIGRDEGYYTTNVVRQTLRGGSLRWTPSERTSLDATVERRFFGNGWNVTLNHRSPFGAVSGNLTRTVSTYASRLGILAAGSDVAGLIDAMLTTRIPDAALRAVAVQDLIAKRGLPDTLSSALEIFSGTAQVTQGGSLTLAWMGTRHVVTMRVFAERSRDLQGPDDVLLVSGDSEQRGASVGLSRRLTPDMTADAGYTYARVKGRGVNEGRDTVNATWRVGLTESLSPRTSVTASLRYQTVDASTPEGTAIDGSRFAATSTQAAATSLSVGFLHRF